MRNYKLDAAFDQLVKTLPKKTLLSLQPPSYPLNVSTDSSDDFQSPHLTRKDSLYLYATPPLDISGKQFFSPCLFSNEKELGKEPKSKKAKKNQREPKAAKKKPIRKKPLTKVNERKPSDSNEQLVYNGKTICNWDEIDKMVTPIAVMSKKTKNCLQKSDEIRQALFSETKQNKRKGLSSRDINTCYVRPFDKGKTKLQNFPFVPRSKGNSKPRNENCLIPKEKHSGGALDTPGICKALLSPSNKDSESECLFSSDNESLCNGGLSLQKGQIQSTSRSLGTPSLGKGIGDQYKTSTPNDLVVKTPAHRCTPVFGARLSSIQNNRQRFEYTNKLVNSAKQRLEKIAKSCGLEAHTSHDFKMKNSIRNYFQTIPNTARISVPNEPSVAEAQCENRAAEGPPVIGKTGVKSRTVPNAPTFAKRNNIPSAKLVGQCKVRVQLLSQSDIMRIKRCMKRSVSLQDLSREQPSSKRQKFSPGGRTKNSSFGARNRGKITREGNTSEELFRSCDKPSSFDNRLSKSSDRENNRSCQVQPAVEAVHEIRQDRKPSRLTENKRKKPSVKVLHAAEVVHEVAFGARNRGKMTCEGNTSEELVISCDKPSSFDNRLSKSSDTGNNRSCQVQPAVGAVHKIRQDRKPSHSLENKRKKPSVKVLHAAEAEIVHEVAFGAKNCGKMTCEGDTSEELITSCDKPSSFDNRLSKSSHRGNNRVQPAVEAVHEIRQDRKPSRSLENKRKKPSVKVLHDAEVVHEVGQVRNVSRSPEKKRKKQSVKVQNAAEVVHEVGQVRNVSRSPEKKHKKQSVKVQNAAEVVHEVGQVRNVSHSPEKKCKKPSVKVQHAAEVGHKVDLEGKLSPSPKSKSKKLRVKVPHAAEVGHEIGQEGKLSPSPKNKTNKQSVNMQNSKAIDKSSPPKLTQTCLPFLPDNGSPKLTQTCLPFLPDNGSPKSVCSPREKDSSKEGDIEMMSDSSICISSPVTSDSSSSGQSLGKLRQTLLDMFLSTDSDFSGFPDPETTPEQKSRKSASASKKTSGSKNNKINKETSSSSPLPSLSSSPSNLKASSSLKASKYADMQSRTSDSRTRSLISYFLDLSVHSETSRIVPKKPSQQVLKDGVKCNTSIIELLQGKVPKVELTRLDEGLVKAALHGPLTAKSKVMCLCGQTEPIPFKNVFPQRVLRSAKKIGEGSYGEVFSMTQVDGTDIAVKIIPIEGDKEVNGGPQMSFKDILSEVILSKQLHDLSRGKYFQTSNFVQLHKVSCVVGKYPQKLLTVWKDFESSRGTENDNPGIFGHDQLYIIFQFSFGGMDLEIYKLKNEEEAVSIFSQVACCLAVAESALEFEHRDLHWGNILVAASSHHNSNFLFEGRPLSIKTSGVSVSLIDFTLSRIKADVASVYKDISEDPHIFNGKGDIQFEVYRKMKEHNLNKWDGFYPYTNILWLEYLAKKLLVKLNQSKAKKTKKGVLSKWSTLSKQYKSTRDFVSTQFQDVKS